MQLTSRIQIKQDDLGRVRMHGPFESGVEVAVQFWSGKTRIFSAKRINAIFEEQLSAYRAEASVDRTGVVRGPTGRLRPKNTIAYISLRPADAKRIAQAAQMALISLGVVAEILEISRSSALGLSLTGGLGPVTMRGNRTLIDMETVVGLAQTPYADPTAIHPSLVVRLGRPTPVEDDWRAFVGWSEQWSPEDKMNAIRGDWNIRQRSVPMGTTLVATTGPFIVAVFTTIASSVHGGRLRFDLAPATDAAIAAFTGKRLHLPVGPVLMRLNP